MSRRDFGAFSLSRKAKFLSVVDIGSSKIVCLIARLSPHTLARAGHEYLPFRTHKVEVLGFGMQKSHGMRGGVVVDIKAVEQSIRLAVDAAERMCGFVIDSVLVNFSCRSQKSHHIESEVPLNGRVGERDVRRVLAQGSRAAFEIERPILHALPISFQLDDERGVRDPVDLIGDVLKVDMHVVSVDASPLRNLEQAINRSHLAVEAVVPTALASGLAVLMEDEVKLETCCIDIGADTTNLAIFDHEKFVHIETLPVGGRHITLDIARYFSVSLDEAERIKVLHGTVGGNEFLENHDMSMFEADILSGEEVVLDGASSSALLPRIIRARVEEILNVGRARLEACGFGIGVGRRFVLTGGGAGLTGLGQLARQVLGGRVRTGRPLGISGLPDVARGSAFATAAGLLIYPQTYGFKALRLDRQSVNHDGEIRNGPLLRAKRWLSAHF